MRVARLVGVLVACIAAASTTARAEPSVTAPRFSLSKAVALPGEEVTARVTGAFRQFKRAIRLYLVPEGAASQVRTRLDQRLTFVGTFTPRRTAVSFTVPPLEPGLYGLAYWCSGCAFPRGKRLAVQRLTLIRIRVPGAPGVCAVTNPNGKAPPGAQPSARSHGNDRLSLFLPTDGVLRTRNDDGTLFEKMIWIAARPSGRRLVVKYERLESADPPRTAETIAGMLSGYSGPSWASRMYFTAGCWQVVGRVDDVSLTFVVQVVRV
jgi:hypothetical protein